MGHDAGRASQGITAFDVSAEMRAMQRQYNGVIRFHIDLPVREVRGVAFVMRVSITRRNQGRSDAVWERGESLNWPTGAARTLTGLQYNLLHLLARKLDEEENAARASAQSRLAGM